MDVTCNGGKVRCCKEQNCIGTWNVRLMNQAKLEVLKQEMVRVKTDILGISELRWTECGELCSRIPLKKLGSHDSQYKSPKCSTWMQSEK